MKCRVSLSLILFPIGLSAQQAPRDTATLAEIVVTATRVPVARAAVTSSIAVLRGEDLRAQGVRYVADALRSVPGAAVVQAGSFGGATSLFLRGGESDYVQVLVDGVAVNAAGGTFDLANLTTDNVERIEVVAGPTSVLYGSDAVAGVVQVFTRRGQGKPQLEAEVKGGSHGSLSLGAALRGGDERLDYSFDVTRFTTDGTYAFNNNHRNAVASARVRVAPDARTDATFTLRHRDAVFHYPTDGGGQLTDHNQFTFDEGTTFGLDAGRFFTDRVEARVLLAANQGDNGSDDRSDTPADTLGFYGSESMTHSARRSADARVNVHAGMGTIATAGAQVMYETARGFSQFSSQFGLSTGQGDFHRLNRGYYAQVLAEPVGGLSLAAGGRLDDNETFGNFTTYRVGASYRLPTGSRVRASLGTGFKEPTFDENFDTGFSTGNASLKPERSQSWEIGLEQSMLGGLVFISGTYFSQDFKDLIQYTFLTPTPTSPNYFNIASAKSSGLELGARTVVAGRVRIEGTYTSLHTEATNAGYDSGPDATFVNGERLLRRPATTVSGHAAVDFKLGSIGAGVRYVGDRADRDFSAFPSPRVTLPAYSVFDLSAELTVIPGAPGLTLTAKIENLADKRYEEIANFPARGRSLFVGGRARI